MTTGAADAETLLAKISAAAVNAVTAATRAEQFGLDISAVASRAEQLLASAGLAALPDNEAPGVDGRAARVVLAAAWSAALVTLEELRAAVGELNRQLAQQAVAEDVRTQASQEEAAFDALHAGKYKGVLAPQGSAERKLQWTGVARLIGEAAALDRRSDYDGALTTLQSAIDEYPWFPATVRGSTDCVTNAEDELRNLAAGKSPYRAHWLDFVLRDVNSELAACK